MLLTWRSRHSHTEDSHLKVTLPDKGLEALEAAGLAVLPEAAETSLWAARQITT